MSNKLCDLETQHRIADALEHIGIRMDKNANADTSFGDSLVLALIDGTPSGFVRAMKAYMQIHNIKDNSTAADITKTVTGFYDLLQQNFEWDGYVTFADPAVSSVSTGTKGGDNQGMVCAPSTVETANQDDYAGLPLFACVDCNWIIDSTSMTAQVTAIKGVVGDYKAQDPGVFVGVIQMTGYHYYTNPHEVGNLTYLEGYRIGLDASKPHCAPMPEAVLPDGTVRSWMIHGKYAAGLKDGKYTCCSGIVEAGQQSHNSSHTYAAAVGTGYAPMCSCDLGFLQLMVRIKYASLTLDNILALANNYYISSVAQVAEVGVKRVIIPASQKGNFIVGSQIQVGNASSTDPQNSNTYAISGKEGWTITAIEDVTIGGTAYAAIYVDAPATFDTGAGNSDATLNTGIHTVLWRTGTTDHVKGNDGAIECLSGKYPIKIQGIEFGLGAWEVLGDTIFKLYKDDGGSYWYEPYVCKTASKLSTTITSDYHSTGVKFSQAMPEGYIKAQSWGSDGVLLPTETGGSSSTYTRDYLWHSKDTENTEREWLSFGALNNGVPSGGLSCVYGSVGLGAAWWYYASRLSPNGSRG